MRFHEILDLVYGKRPFWQWIVIYIVVGAIVYGVIYFFFLAPKGSSYNSNYNPPSSLESTVKPAQNTITLTSAGFSPAALTVKARTTVTWVNQSGSDGSIYSTPHPVHNSYPPLNLGSFPNGSTLSLTFDKPGNYGYHNHLNPSQTGTIIVQ